jgi:hypothetical protein
MLAGTPVEVKWHVTVDRTQGQAMDIVVFYAEAHPGVFIGQFAPGIKPGDGVMNAIHMHRLRATARRPATSTISCWARACR